MMAYRIADAERTVEQALRRVADQQMTRAIRSIDRLDEADAVHDVRRRCKKMRALLRLVRPALADYERENAALRDIARIISGARDNAVMLATYDLLAADLDKGHGRRALGIVRRRLTLQRKEQAALSDPAEFLDMCRAQLAQLRDRAAGWSLARDGWNALGPGLARSYRRLHRERQSTRSEGTADAFHRLRKQVKYHGFQMRLLAPLWPEEMAVRGAVAADIGDMLGLHHDLWVFETRIAAAPDIFGSGPAIDAMLALARLKRAELESRSIPLLNRLLSETPFALEERLGALWNGWRNEPFSRS